ncbi:MAG: LmeA family phospholipid-binding protein [Synergistaceae bacterium]|jgi:hypothetical protein|nr:LmeA family phospholipid-binding protein [Synergistaceae bacterium]
MRCGFFFAVTAFILLFCSIASAADLTGDFPANTAEEKFVKALVNTLKPETLEVVFGGTPAPDGTLSRIYVRAHGISAGTDWRLDDVALTGSLVKLTPPDQWDANDIKTFRPEKWEGLFNVEVVLKEADAKNALRIFMAKGGKNARKWRDLNVDFRAGSLFLSGVYSVNSGIRATFEITTGLELRSGTQIWLVDTNVRVNRDDQTDAIRSEIKKVNPPLDFSKSGIPVTLRSLSVTNDEIRVGTATPPQPFPGTTYRCKK